MDDRNQLNPFIPDLRRFSSAPFPSLPHYHPPALLLHSWPGSNQPPPATFSDPSFGFNHDGSPLVASAATQTRIGTFELGGCSSGGSSRWPRQETLTLLEIRSSLADKFKDANHKAPLWDEVSRIMSEEYGYQRTGKKCREKFQNVYKYYKKTKDGKMGRHDGKNYRFFSQLEAIQGRSGTVGSQDDTLDLVKVYGVQTSNVEIENRSGQAESPQCSPSFSNSMSVDYHQLDILSEEENNGGGEGDGELLAIAFAMAEKKKMRRSVRSEAGQVSKMCVSKGSGKSRKGWKEKVSKLVDGQVTRLLERQEDWIEKMLRKIESNEQGRVRREMEWRERESSRFEREHELWAKERAWMEARDAAFVAEITRKFMEKEDTDNYSPLNLKEFKRS